MPPRAARVLVHLLLGLAPHIEGGGVMRLNRLPSTSTTVPKRTTCEACGRSPFRWEYTTNGDGSAVQECPDCHTLYPVGRWFASPEVGIRIPGSVWSALVTTPSTPDAA
jgi:hypothetical protein